ncbi:putative aspartic protease [Lentinula raphanica]|uniref:Aspartic protease n=1 Tax=Lentinula raphanica TaxID=153919 RepID=A0AA38P559_9AGAR|nr:putative aspartic protease [Lentinula raphanica]KAJ3758405.1 putative aspartic protease [Lentinula raphanica]KAJ3770294.1 putative aspartic protease [Lentinula raphanica]KAJ3825465.1 putative aspartic protease [Lentinula raphanica]KAJ3836525.1 putative aspartic protease [Lentinula raphanica]
MSRVVVNSIPIAPQLAADVDNLRSLVQKDLQRAQKHLSQHTIGHGPRAVQEARRKFNHSHHHDDDGSGSTPKPDPVSGKAITVDDATVTYMMTCNIGGSDYNLLIDTGSSNTWCGANKKFEPDSSCESTRDAVNVSYGSGSFSGTEYTGTVVLGGKGSAMKIEKQSFAVATRAQGFGGGMDGILGIGPVDLTSTTVHGMSSIPTVTDNLFKQGLIDTECIGIAYNPTQQDGNMANGELIFGGVDQTKIDGEVSYVPITSTSPASKYWGIEQEITYGSSKKMILKKTAGIVDTGTTLIMMADDAFDAYKAATGASMDQATGLLKLTSQQFEKLQSLNFEIGDTTFELTPNAQIWPRALNSALGGDSDSIYTVFASMGEISGIGLDFINGFTWLQRFYSVYDVTNQRVGIANTPNTKAETN